MGAAGTMMGWPLGDPKKGGDPRRGPRLKCCGCRLFFSQGPQGPLFYYFVEHFWRRGRRPGSAASLWAGVYMYKEVGHPGHPGDPSDQKPSRNSELVGSPTPYPTGHPIAATPATPLQPGAAPGAGPADTTPTTERTTLWKASVTTS